MTYYRSYSVLQELGYGVRFRPEKNTSRLFYMTPAKCEIFTVFPLSYLSSTSQVGNSSRHILFSQRPFNVFLFTSPIWEKDTHIRTKYVNSWITADSFYLLLYNYCQVTPCIFSPLHIVVSGLGRLISRFFLTTTVLPRVRFHYNTRTLSSTITKVKFVWFTYKPIDCSQSPNSPRHQCTQQNSLCLTR